MSEEFIS